MKALLSFLFIILPCLVFAQTPDKPNVLFIISDDLNSYVSILGGHPQVNTPNIDSLAQKGILFTNAFTSAPGCAPSRTSFLSGKDLDYTQVYNNGTYENIFRDNFTEAKGNEEVYTLPQILKDTGGYYTFAINKIFHSPDKNDFDKDTEDPCEKNLSWNRMVYSTDFNWLEDDMESTYFGNTFDWGVEPDSIEDELQDYRTVDTALLFLNQVNAGTANTCGKPFFLAVGFHYPHADRFVPEHYFSDYYQPDLYAEPYTLPYNYPFTNYPYNGIVMAPQPATEYGDYFALPAGGIARAFADDNNIYDAIINYRNSLTPTPGIDPDLSDAERDFAIDHSIQADYTMSYIAAVEFMDTELGRLLHFFNTHPAMAENTIIVFVSDHGYSLGEKRHYTKWTLWDNNLRVPFIIYDPLKTGHKICSRSVGLLDLFPTICDLTGTHYPKFSDGSNYLDGASIVPLLNNPTRAWERPVLTSLKKNSGNGHCFPQLSVRNEQFHYISYRTNGATGGSCNLALSSTAEEELYEIGSDRSVDPNEWHNLAYDPDYAPVKKYLRQWLPDSSMYMQKAFRADILNNPVPCSLSNTDVITLSSKFFYPAGNAVPVAALTNYTFKWTNSINATILTGKSIAFNMSLISPAAFASHTKMVLYLNVIDNASGKSIAFAVKTFYLSSGAVPVADYTAMLSAGTVAITGYSITGSYSHTSWAFGDGGLSEDLVPAPHTYSAIGNYTIRNYVYYGNACKKSFNKKVHVTTLKAVAIQAPVLTVHLYPIPANTQFAVVIRGDVPVSKASVELINLQGQIVKDMDQVDASTNIIPVDVSNIPAGSYVVRTILDGQAFNNVVEVVH